MVSEDCFAGKKLVIAVTYQIDPKAIEEIKAIAPSLTIEFKPIKSWYPEGFPTDRDFFIDADFLLTLRYLPATLDLAPKLQYAQLSQSGVDSVVNTEYVTKTDYPLCNASGVHGPQICEYVFMEILNHNHHAHYLMENQRKGFFELTVTEGGVEDLTDARIGVIGYGSIGRQIGRVAKAHGMKVIAYTSSPRTTPESRVENNMYVPSNTGDPQGLLPDEWHHGKTKEDFDNFLALAKLDYLVMALPLTPITNGMLGKKQFEIMTSGVNQGKKPMLVNIGRGPIVKTMELIDALNNDVIGAAALDVTDPEPLPSDHPLWKTKNCTISPHRSGKSNKYVERVLEILIQNLKNMKDGKPLINTVSRHKGY
ncbi:hypothetical protein NADFUDRAFT_52841 [Nadsonia fulvescens var. elongata DSM 6958]|uniref:D-isomer specific 2-hydroxyacid dehydrogenase NAD-binding domain-containing protein n=1 Tax=Nadsonia fulvescens var. elongata DSM 6958 TaxID=857566 RepID=A0A1E3PEV7_9ASCO|nr:hypothetical protein NADFUDRAFT_52841 [Nadsonia fulvescens var. elongata DSM 6958]